MRKLILWAISFAAAIVLVPVSARAAIIPSAANSTVPKCILLVGNLAGVPDAVGSFTVTVRDQANNPWNSASVVIDLSGCTDIAICEDQLDAGALVSYAAKTTRKFTNNVGQVSFIVLGGSKGGTATTLQGGARVFANGVLIGSPTAAALDLDGAGGVSINDLSVWLSDFGSPGNPAFGRSDYDCSGSVSINDLSVWLQEFGLGRSVASCFVNCP